MKKISSPPPRRGRGAQVGGRDEAGSGDGPRREAPPSAARAVATAAA